VYPVIATIAVLLGLLIIPGHTLASSGRPVDFWYASVGEQYVSLRGLASGAVGKGIIGYYLRSRGASRPSLVVELSKLRNGPAIARVYDAPVGMRWVPVVPSPTGVGFLPRPGLQPVIVMKAVGGYWVRRHQANYNLDVLIYGSVQAMWGSGSQSGDSAGYAPLLKASELSYKITTRTGASGVPLWDLRELVPPFAGDGYIRVNYAQRECTEKVAWAPSLVSMWPYVRTEGGFAEPHGEIEPPIVVNLRSGRVTLFGEIVSVRGGPCSYDFYSLRALGRRDISRLDFESPWGFYNWSSRKTTLPNEIIRTQYFPANDSWQRGVDPTLLNSAPLANRSQEDVRMSWAEHAGNQLFGYKVDVFGYHQYRTMVRIAGGKIKVYAPSYRNYPKWVVDHRWPVATFIDDRSAEYATSEGIYQWAALLVGSRYLRGWSNAARLNAFDALPIGFRGEYRVGSMERPRLYISMIDRRVHLLGADGGIWNLGNGWYLVEGNLDDGDAIDAWTLEHVAGHVGGRVGETRERQDIPGNPSRNDGRASALRVVERLDVLDGVLLYSGTNGVVVRKSPRLRPEVELVPPTGRATWRAFLRARQRLGPGRNPRRLDTWVNAFVGPEAAWHHATLGEVGALANGFVAVLKVRRGFGVSQIPGLSGIGPGRWVLRYQVDSSGAHWTVERAVGPRVSARVRSVDMRVLYPATIYVAIHDSGSVPWTGTIRLLSDGSALYDRQVGIAAGGTVMLRVVWTPTRAGITNVRVEADGTTMWKGRWVVKSIDRPKLRTLWTNSSLSVTEGSVGVALILCVAGALVRWLWL
jgi:hypothetical protein